MQTHSPYPHTCLPSGWQILQIQSSCTNLDVQDLHIDFPCIMCSKLEPYNTIPNTIKMATTKDNDAFEGKVESQSEQ